MRLIVIGRDPRQAQIVIPNDFISNYHAEIIQTDNGEMFIVDKSTNGTFVNGSRIVSGKEVRLRHGDDVYFTEYKIPLDWSQVPVDRKPENVKRIISIGSHNMNSIVINGSSVSRCHATIREMNDGKWYICDHSQNGTTLNGKNIPKNSYVPLKAGDEISCAGIPVDNPVPGKNRLGFVIAGVAVAAVCIIAVVVGLLLSNRTLSDEQLIAKYDKSVAMMMVTYHFEVSSTVWDVSSLIDNRSKVARKYGEPSVRDLTDKFVLNIENGQIDNIPFVPYNDGNAMTMTGSGFFVGENGTIVTNRQVAKPWERLIRIDSATVTLEDYAEIYYKSLLGILLKEEYVDIDAMQLLSQVEVRGVIDNVYIIPNGTYVQDDRSLISCIEIACGSVSEDLALFQILSGRLPEDVEPIPMRKIKEQDPQRGAHVLTIGFPGETSAISDLVKTRIQARATAGAITMNDGKYTFGFDAVSNTGACGSPVFDERGNLMGVISSSRNEKPGSNEGVRVRYVIALLQAAEIAK